MKGFEMLPTEDNLLYTLDKNILQRNKELVYFYNLLLAQEGASSIAVDGRWGCGKTFFVKQSMLVINAKNPMSKMDDKKRESIVHNLPFPSDKADDSNYDLAVYYDAWENDNDMDPLISIVYEIAKQLGLIYQFDAETDIFKLAASILEAFSGRNINDIINLNYS